MLGVATTIALALSAPCLAQAQETQKDRREFAAQAVGLTLAYFEGQRAGTQPDDAVSLYPTVWGWKEPAYTDMCSEAAATVNATDSTLGTYGGYYEAGNAVLATGTLAFTAVQRMVGALEFMPFLSSFSPQNAVGDSAGCMRGGHSSATLKTLVLREMRFMGKSLASTILSADASDFTMVVGVGDTSTYRDDEPLPSWMAPLGDQQKCYIADAQNPAADIAAQLAAGLAMCAKMARDQGTAADATVAADWDEKAAAALAYADRMIQTFGSSGATCSASSADDNCVGSTCTTIDPDDGSPTDGTCTLYPNGKPADEQMFVANAALWYSTGIPSYRSAADGWYRDSDDFAPSWNNVQPQGLILMAGAPNSPDGSGNSQSFYRGKLAVRAAQWATCSSDGVGAYGDGKAYCRRTPGGSAYPLDVPWGNMGAITNGVCLAAITEKYNADPANSSRNRCFMQRQLGYMFNHKCATCTEIDTSNDTKDFNNTRCSLCDTPDSGGFSYMVGLGGHYPTRLHSRDAAFPNFDEEFLPDGNLLCGALVAGPYAHGSSGEDGRTEVGTDLFTNNRDLWFEAEPALDYSASMICALAGYASLEGPISECGARSPLTGRPGAGLTSRILSGADLGTSETPPLSVLPAPVPTPPPPPPPPAASPPPPPAAGGACGGNGEPLCAGDDLDGREFECDYGFAAEGGICVPWVFTMDEGPPPGTACGGDGEVVCSGPALMGRDFECDFGFIGSAGICIPYAEFAAAR